MRILKSNPVLTLLNSYLVDSPQPSTLSYLWNFGSLLGLCLIAQIITGVLIAMHVSPTAETAFQSIEHIMRDVNEGWLLRYCHANMASFFFIAVYLHIARGLYYGSYRTPRIGVWVIGTVIFFLMMATAFLGYVIPFGQMSMWGVVLKNRLNYFYNSYSLLRQKIYPDKNFMSMFVGFVDGDGYIEIGPQKQYNKSNIIPKSTIRIRLVIRLHEKDTEFIKYLVEVLSVGSISFLKSKNQVRLIFSKTDLCNVIIPLVKLYNLEFLIFNRKRQYALLNYILDNNIKHWENVKFRESESVTMYKEDFLVQLDYFPYWVVGFTIAEGSFGFKLSKSAFYSIKQKGLINYSIIRAIGLLITGKIPNKVKPDSADCYQLTLTSKSDIQKVVNFFSNEDCLLLGHKLKQYQIWLSNLKKSKRYKETIISNE
jgi:Cytochrome b/b6/petB/LAGLIDADG endonuclease